MLRSLDIEGYRVFSKYRLEDLAQVNLLVGKNNCGKTSVLEAVHVLASRGDPDVVAKIASNRGEMAPEAYGGASSPGESVDISHLFHNRQVQPASSFTISSNDGLGSLKAQLIEREDAQQGSSSEPLEPVDLTDDAPRWHALALYLRSSGSSFFAAAKLPVRVVGNSVLLDPRRLAWHQRVREPREGPPVCFVAAEVSTQSRLRQMWDAVLLEGREREVVEALKVLEPRTENIFFLTAERNRLRRASAHILVAMEGDQERHPIGSYGDGMTRLLTLALAMVSAKGGVLLIDEIDTGLHYSILGDMWRLVVETARRTDVQVFATTHSYDCLRGLARLCEDYPDLCREVRVQKIEPSLDKSVALGGEEIMSSIAQGTEMR